MGSAARDCQYSRLPGTNGRCLRIVTLVSDTIRGMRIVETRIEALKLRPERWHHILR